MFDFKDLFSETYFSFYYKNSAKNSALLLFFIVCISVLFLCDKSFVFAYMLSIFTRRFYTHTHLRSKETPKMNGSENVLIERKRNFVFMFIFCTFSIRMRFVRLKTSGFYQVKKSSLLLRKEEE